VYTWKLLKLFASSDFQKILLLDSDLIVHELSIQCINDLEGELISSRDQDSDLSRIALRPAMLRPS
jgi:hypothetical protein